MLGAVEGSALVSFIELFSVMDSISHIVAEKFITWDFNLAFLGDAFDNETASCPPVHMPIILRVLPCKLHIAWTPAVIPSKCVYCGPAFGTEIDFRDTF